MEIRYRKERQKKSSRYLILKKKDLDEEIEPQIIPNAIDKIDYRINCKTLPTVIAAISLETFKNLLYPKEFFRYSGLIITHLSVNFIDKKH